MNRLNFRPLLFWAFGLSFGIFLYGKMRFGGLAPSDFLFLTLFVVFALRPLSWKRTLSIIFSVLIFAGAGAFSVHLYTSSYLSTVEAGEYRLSGTVTAVSMKNGYSVVILEDVSLNGASAGGKCRVFLSGGDMRPADEIVLTAQVKLAGSEYDFAKNVRYTASAGEYEKTGVSKNPFLRLNAALYNTLHAHMEREEADVAYALLTGNSNAMDEGFVEVVRKGGIAHIFAVSGLHIGILFGAAYLCFKPLGKYRVIPAVLIAFCYCALCNFTVSSVRALVMCSAAGVYRAFGRKYDFLQSVSFAAILILLFSPAQWYSVGFRLSFGACLGLALFAGSLSKFFTRLKFPAFLGKYLSAALSVQIFDFPILMESFGYFSVWGFLLNFLVIPLLPVLFLGLLLCALLALLIPPAAGVILLVPSGMLSAFLYPFSVTDFSFVIAGFALGAGGLVFLIACVALSRRFRLTWKGRTAAAVFFAALFAVAVTFENAVFTGCRIDVFDGAALVRTRSESVLIIGDDVSLSECEEFLLRTYGGELTLAVVLSEDEVSAINTAAFLPAKEVRARDKVDTGLQKTKLSFGEAFSCGGLSFRYETRGKLVLIAEGLAVEFDFSANSALGADLFVGNGGGNLKYFLKSGKIQVR